MPLFVISCIDRPDALGLRMATRQAHLAYANTGEKPVKVKIGGPSLDERGNMTGALLIVHAPSREAVAQFSHDDPYGRRACSKAWTSAPTASGSARRWAD